MLKYSIFSVIGLSLLASLSMSCGESNSSSADNVDLTGEWRLEYAERNGAPTETLTGLFLHFTDEDSLTTNFTGVDTVTTGYELNDKELKVLDTQSYQFGVNEISENSMILEINVRDIIFELHFSR